MTLLAIIAIAAGLAAAPIAFHLGRFIGRNDIDAASYERGWADSERLLNILERQPSLN